MSIRVTIWNEFRHERQEDAVRALYPNGIHNFIRDHVLADCEDMVVTTASLDDPEQGLPDELLNNTDVLLWWGHCYHHEVSDVLADKIRDRVYAGMGFLPMHSAHLSKPFTRIVGMTGNINWGRDQTAVLWNVAPQHPITEGIPANFTLDTEELYSEPFYIAPPDDLLFITWYEDGNVFRGGLTYTRGNGKIFYFHPGHESCKAYYNPYVQQILKNGIRWCAPAKIDPSLYNENRHQDTPVFKK